MQGTVTAVIVSYASPQASLQAARSLLDQSHPPLEVLVVDNDEHGAMDSLADALPDGVRLLRPGANLGYTGAVNLAARQARGEWLLCMNPDARAAHDCVERLLAAAGGGAETGAEATIVGAQVLLPDGRVNAGENPVSITGVSWSGHFGAAREHGPAREVAAVSGAAMLVRRGRFLELGGLCPYFFMYVDDTDLAWRVRLSGGSVRFCPQAVVVHDYEFAKGAEKWFYLERNRAWALLSNLRLRTLALLAPVLVATELAVTLRAAREGWLREKLRAWGWLLARLPALLRWRRRVQATRTVGDERVLALFVGGVQSELLERSPPAWANRALERYRLLVLALLRSPQQ